MLQISNESVSHGVGRKLSRSLGSLNSLLSTKRRHPGIPTSTENLHRRASKSSETLNSVGTAESDSEDSSEDDDKETEEEKDLESVMKPSPFIAKKYLH